MRPEPVCRDVRVELSARLDGEADGATEQLVDAHLRQCEACRRHARDLARVRRALRAQPTPLVPDLSEAILGRIRESMHVGPSPWPARLRTGALAAVASALIVAGASLPWSRRPPETAAAGEVSRAVRAAARTLETYRASFDVAERGWHDRVPLRRFDVEVSFRAPEWFRLTVRDRTRYPSAALWPANDVDVVATPTRWWIREPTSCPPEALPGCAVAAGIEERSVYARQPFDGSTTLPTDIVVPLETLATSRNFEVVGRARLLGRAATHVRLSLRQGAPLLGALQVGGSWRSFEPSDRVDLWIDRTTWFPLRFEIRPRAGGPPALRAQATTFSEPRRLTGDLFRAPLRGLRRDGGFSARPSGTWGAGPEFTAGLEPYRAGVTDLGQVVLAYAEGTTWLKVSRDPTPTAPRWRTDAEEIRLDGAGFAYYEPATESPSAESFRRSVDLYGANTSVHIESNLARAELLEVASSLGVWGQRAPRTQRVAGLVVERVPVARALAPPWVAATTRLPAGFRATSAFVSRARDGRTTVTVYLRHREAGYDDFGVRITQSRPARVLPPTSESLVAVRAGAIRGRWSEERGELEWIDHGVLRAVAAPSFGLRTALSIARGLE